ncbi:conserved oligomeric Golgi complex subunit 4 isoform X2 [Myzus persicae]|uniref:conserved oligomeric Golgi complex subunit 4 isoform X2 n=1 Tax=Myzus persicae TaxID=13164 RepID=UPI000B934956|nr:conserved oligomeric Golgi complex subunit 4 isoform X2 [Myzus persicae]
MMSSNEDYITLDEINNALELLDRDEIASRKRLATFTNQWPTVIKEVDSVTKKFSALTSFKENLSQIQTRIHDSSKLAEDISSKVRQLDKIRGRVSECQKRVQDLLDLQLCSEGVQIAMKNDELEQAAGHIHRYLSIDQTKLQRTADDMAQDCSMITSALKHLQEASELLQDTVSKRFEHASLVQDSNSIERYFKIFPLLGMHDVGLEKFVDYLGRLLKVSADKNLKNVMETPLSSNRASVIFADGLTFIFEEVAKTIEVQQPLIETHYGPEYVLKFLSHLQIHCDTFGDILLRTFLKTRKIKELLKTVWEEPDENTAVRPDSKDIDLLVEEIVMILARYDLYAQFVCKRTVNADGVEPKTRTAKTVLDNSRLCCCIQEMMGKYLELERYYMEESIRKAVLMDTIEGDGGDAALTSSMVDDVFFIVRKCVMRSLRSGSLDVLCAVINNAVNALEADMCAVFTQVLAAGYPGSGYFNRFTPDLDKVRRTFLAALNNTEVAVEYSKSLSQAFRDEVPARLRGCHAEKLDSCLHDFSRVNASLVAANRSGFRQLQSSLVEPKALAWMESFYEQHFTLDEPEFAQTVADNPFVVALVRNIDATLAEFRARLTPNNYDMLVVAVAAETAAQLERAVMKTEFNRLGGMALDKVVRTLINYFGGASAWPVREKFARLVQVTTVLNLERASDLNEFSNPDSGMRFSWKLTPDCIRQILRLRVDFREDDIRKVQL